jgi:hypothetical protein
MTLKRPKQRSCNATPTWAMCLPFVALEAALGSVKLMLEIWTVPMSWRKSATWSTISSRSSLCSITKVGKNGKATYRYQMRRRWELANEAKSTAALKFSPLEAQHGTQCGPSLSISLSQK